MLKPVFALAQVLNVPEQSREQGFRANCSRSLRHVARQIFVTKRFISVGSLERAHYKSSPDVTNSS